MREYEEVTHNFGSHISIRRSYSEHADPPESDSAFLLFFHREFTPAQPANSPVKREADLADWLQPPSLDDYRDKDEYEYEYLDWLERYDRDAWVVFEVGAHIHGGVSLYLGDYADAKSDTDGAVFICKADFPADADFKAIAKSVVQEWNTWLEGDVWDVFVEAVRGDGHVIEGETCWSVYTWEAAEEEGRSEAKYLVTQCQPYTVPFFVLYENGTWGTEKFTFQFTERPEPKIPGAKLIRKEEE